MSYEDINTLCSDNSGRATSRAIYPNEHNQTLKIFWVGISAQRNRRGEQESPLTSATPTGVIIDQIISECVGKLTHKRLNLIDRVLLDPAGRLRPPNKQELTEGYRRIVRVMQKNKRCLFIFLGNHIRAHFQAAEQEKIFSLYTVYDIYGTRAVFVHHPSYIRVYRYKTLGDYTDKVANLVATLKF